MGKSIGLVASLSSSAMETRPTKQNLYRGITFALLFLTWMVFSGLFDVFHLTLGVISCGFVTYMSSDLLFEDRSSPLKNRSIQAVRLAGYCVWLIWQIVVANIHLLKLAFGGKDLLQPQIVRYEATSLETDFAKFLLANSITLTPGTVTMKILGKTFYIHAISDFAAKGLDGEMERRIARVFSDREGKPAS